MAARGCESLVPDRRARRSSAWPRSLPHWPRSCGALRETGRGGAASAARRRGDRSTPRASPCALPQRLRRQLPLLPRPVRRRRRSGPGARGGRRSSPAPSTTCSRCCLRAAVSSSATACRQLRRPSGVERGRRRGDGRLPRAATTSRRCALLCILPGSRRGEIARHLPLLGEAVALLWRQRSRLRVVLPTLPRSPPLVEPRRRLAGAGARAADRAERFDAYAASRLAIAASGTVSLEAGARPPAADHDLPHRPADRLACAPPDQGAARQSRQPDPRPTGGAGAAAGGLPPRAHRRDRDPPARGRGPARRPAGGARRGDRAARRRRRPAAQPVRRGPGPGGHQAAQPRRTAVDQQHREVPPAPHHAAGQGPRRGARLLHRAARHEAAAQEGLSRAAGSRSPSSATATRATTPWSSSPTTGATRATTTIGTGFGHLALGVPDIYQACDELRRAGVKITRERRPDEARRPLDRLHRGSRRLQDRADRARLTERRRAQVTRSPWRCSPGARGITPPPPAAWSARAPAGRPRRRARCRPQPSRSGTRTGCRWRRTPS